MKNIIIGLTILASMSSFAGGIVRISMPNDTIREVAVSPEKTILLGCNFDGREMFNSEMTFVNTAIGEYFKIENDLGMKDKVWYLCTNEEAVKFDGLSTL